MLTRRLRASVLAALFIAASALAPAVHGVEPVGPAAGSEAPGPHPSLAQDPQPAELDGESFAPAPAAATATYTWITNGDHYGTRGIAETFWFGITPAPDGGMVELRVDGNLVQSVDVTPGAGSGSVSWTPATIGTFSIVLVYSGTAAYASSSTEPWSVEVRQPVPTGMTIESSANPAARGADVTFTLTISPAPGSGSVEWLINGVTVATTTLDVAGKSTHTTSFPTTGYAYVAARFLGNDDWSPRLSEPFQQWVTGDAIAISLSVPSNPMPAGNVVVTGTLSPNPGGGTVRFTLWRFGPTVDVPVAPDGTAAVDLGNLGPQDRQVEALFLGTDVYASASATLAFSVWATSSVVATANRTTATVGELPVVLSAAVNAQGGPPDGTVTFSDNVGGVVVQLGPVPINSYTGIASFPSNALRVGTHTITAHYAPPSGWLPSQSAPITVTVYADTAVHATFKPSLATFYPYKDGFRDTVALGGVLDERASVTIKVYSSTGSLKRTWSLGTRNAGAYSVTWNGRTATGVALPAGKYKAVALIKDTKAHSRTFTVYTTVSWRKAVWKSASVLRYASTGSYYTQGFGGDLYYSNDYPNGRILDSGPMVRDCVDCGWIGGRFTFALASTALEYRSLYVQIRGHGFSDREHPGSGSIEHPTTGAFAATTPLCLYDQPGVVCGIPVSKSYVSSTKQLKAWVWMTQAWGDAYDLYYVKLTYQYAVWAP